MASVSLVKEDIMVVMTESSAEIRKRSGLRWRDDRVMGGVLTTALSTSRAAHSCTIPATPQSWRWPVHARLTMGDAPCFWLRRSEEDPIRRISISLVSGEVGKEQHWLG